MHDARRKTKLDARVLGIWAIIPLERHTEPLWVPGDRWASHHERTRHTLCRTRWTQMYCCRMKDLSSITSARICDLLTLANDVPVWARRADERRCFKIHRV